MNEYYIIKSNVTTPVKPILLQANEYAYKLSDENFKNMPQGSSGYYEYRNDVCSPDLLTHPTFMVSDLVKNAIEIYHDNLEWKQLYVMPTDERYINKGVQLFYIPRLEGIDCLVNDVVILPNGAVKDIILDNKKLKNNDIFYIEGIVENIVIVSLRLVESILRRNPLGISFERVEVR